ncbi:MAG: mechanosensitive ion channel [Chloroflexi bacterium]|nr:mechanosensitive ion channel [Chloroflexota bacterium]
MSFQEIWESIGDQLTTFMSGYFLNVVGAVLILLVGWVVAFAVARLVRRAVRSTGLAGRVNRWLSGGEGQGNVQVEQWVGRIVFWVLFLLVLAIVASTLRLDVVTTPLNLLLEDVVDFIPSLIFAVLLLLAGWIAASILKVVALRVSRSTRLDERLGQVPREGQAPAVPVSRLVGDFVFWLVLLLVLPAVLTTLAPKDVLVPVQAMVTRALGFLPDLFAGGLILVVGWLLARIAQRVVASLLAAVGADRLLERAGIHTVVGQRQLSTLLGQLVFFLILIPVFIATLDALSLGALTEPASRMLGLLLGALPAVFGAALLLGIVFVAARIFSQLIRNVLTEAGFNSILVRIGLGREPEVGHRTPSEVVGYLVFAGAMLFAVIEAAQLLGFSMLADLTARFLVLALRVVVGLVILAIGLWLANLAATAINATHLPQGRALAAAARVGVVVLVAAIAMQEVGLANNIIVLAFGIPLAAIGLAVAIAFGTGARESAGREVERWIEHLRGRGSGS